MGGRANIEAGTRHFLSLLLLAKNRVESGYREVCFARDRPGAHSAKFCAHRLFIAQRVNGIHPRCPSRRNIAGSKRAPEQDPRRCGEGQWIERANVEKLIPQ
jgi:hypothetical protein